MLAVPTHGGSYVEGFKVILANDSIGPGGVVSGQLTFRITAPKQFHRVSIKIMGKEFVSIHKGKYAGEEASSQVTHSAHSNVHKEHITILGGTKGSKYSGSLLPGRYTFPFSFLIPPNAPPTIIPAAAREGSDGEGQLIWYVKAKIDTSPSSPSDVDDVAMFYVSTAMPMSQYKLRSTLLSPLHRSRRRSLLCCDQGTTTLQMTLAQNMLVLGIDKTLDGYITIDNHESKEGTSNVLLSLSRMCWIKVGEFEAVSAQRITGATVVTAMKAGDDEKRFDFSIPLSSDHKFAKASSSSTNSSGSTYKGRILSHYYQLTAICGEEVIFKTPLMVSSELDPSNNCPVIVTDRPGPLVPAKQYPQYVYAPPPEEQVSYPSGAAALMTQQTRAVPQFEFVSPHHLCT